MRTTGWRSRENQAKRYCKMKKMRITALILAACMLLALLAGCSKQENSADTQDEVTLPMTEEQEPVVDGPEIPDDDEGPVTVTDMSGREITLEQPADRIVALAAAAKECSLNYKKCSADELHTFFAEVLPAYDRDRVHDSDIKKLIQWYNILVNNGITDFEAALAPTMGDNVDDRQEAE